jgi:hypothetical protein
VIPTAVVEIVFSNGYWQKGEDEMEETDDQFLERIQSVALKGEQRDGALTFVEYVMRTLSTEEQERLRGIAAEAGLQTEIQLMEMLVNTKAARSDIEQTIKTADELVLRKHHGVIVSEHKTASGSTRIEIDNRKKWCYIATACYGDVDHPSACPTPLTNVTNIAFPASHLA